MTPKEQKYLIGGTVAVAAAYFLFFSNTESGNGVDPTGNGGPGTTDPRGFNAFTVATDLYEAMKDSGTDEEAVVYILKTVTAAQFDQVFEKFGRLNYNPLLGNQYSVWGNLDKYDLKGWLKNELSPAEYANWKRKYPNRL